MPIPSIIIQPSTNLLSAAYRPVLIRVQATGTDSSAKPPVVYCDIYFGGVFYKTLSKTQYAKLNTVNSEWEFDLQDAAQEYLSKLLAANGGTVVVSASQILTKAQCKFRSSGYDANGFIVPEGTIPVQGTGGTLPVAGTGTASNEFYIINCTLQHEDNQALPAHLSTFKTGDWNSNCYPLTHRPARYLMSRIDSDYFPAIIDSTLCIAGMVLKYRYIGQSLFRSTTAAVTETCNAIISSITVSQVGGTQNALISWVGSGSGITSYRYRVDGGSWVTTTNTSATINSLSVAAHLVEVAANCQCAQGATNSKVFDILSSEVFTCDTLVSDVAMEQTSEGAATLTFTSTGAATVWRYSIDGAPPVAISTTTAFITGISIGSHSIVVTPICDNAVPGTSGSLTFDILGMPAINKLSENVSGGLRTQVFQIGTHVNPGNIFTLTVYSHNVNVSAVGGDTPNSIAIKMRDAVNATTADSFGWDEFGSAPPPGTPGYPPTATASGANVTVVLNSGNSFAYSAQLD